MDKANLKEFERRYLLDQHGTECMEGWNQLKLIGEYEVKKT